MRNESTGAQLYAWVLAATLPAILCVAGKNGWITVLIFATVCAIVTFCALNYCKKIASKWLCIAELFWILIFLGSITKISATCWESVKTPMAVPIILLVLAALASQNGVHHNARAGATLVWITLPILGVVALAGTADINRDWIRVKPEVPDSLLISLLLLPCVAAFLPANKRPTRWIGVILCVASVAISILLDGTMGHDIATSAQNSFYELSKGIVLLGVAERFEGLVACALTAGWFGTFSLLLCAIYHLTEKIFNHAAKWSVWIGAAVATVLMCILPKAGYWLVIGTLIFWVFLPALTQVVGRAKNIEKK